MRQRLHLKDKMLKEWRGHEEVTSFAGKVFLADGPPGSSEPPMGRTALETLLTVWAQPCCWRVAPQQSPFPRPAAVQSYGKVRKWASFCEKMWGKSWYDDNWSVSL